MEQIEKLLEKLDIPVQTREAIISDFDGDDDKIMRYLIACLARYDDSHEFLD